MMEDAQGFDGRQTYPVGIVVRPQTEDRNRLTTAFRFFLSLPHIIMVGWPWAVGGWLGWHSQQGWSLSSGSGIIGAIAGLGAVLAWVVIVVTRRHPRPLWRLAAFFLRWRVRALAYMTLLRDDYPPFGDDPYPAELALEPPAGPRDRLTVLVRLLLAVPHLILMALLGMLWSFTTALAWVVILLTGRFPEVLYGFGLGVLAWTVRVEAYVLLLRDEYPPFTLRA